MISDDELRALAAERSRREARNYYHDTDLRMLHDNAFHGAVMMLMALAQRHGFTPGELKQVAFRAALELEMRRPLSSPSEVAERWEMPFK